MTYNVTGIGFDSFREAIAAASASGSNVVENATGLTRWEPAPKASKKKLRMYEERKAAREAYERGNQ